MIILGFLGSPRVNGTNSRLLKKALKGAESRGAETKIFELIKCNIKFCTACFNCVHKNPELPIGECLLEDDMASILKEYIRADGYVFASPNYDGSVTALMKRFLERKIALTYRPKEEVAAWLAKDPIKGFQEKLVKLDIVNLKDLEMIRQNILEELNEAEKFAKESPFPEEISAMEGVYA